MSKVIKRIFNIFIDILVVLILLVSAFVVVLSLTTESSGVSNILGIAPLSVQTASMEDTINAGDLIFCDVAEDEEEYQIVVDVYNTLMDEEGLNDEQF